MVVPHMFYHEEGGGDPSLPRGPQYEQANSMRQQPAGGPPMFGAGSMTPPSAAGGMSNAASLWQRAAAMPPQQQAGGGGPGGGLSAAQQAAMFSQAGGAAGAQSVYGAAAARNFAYQNSMNATHHPGFAGHAAAAGFGAESRADSILAAAMAGANPQGYSFGAGAGGETDYYPPPGRRPSLGTEGQEAERGASGGGGVGAGGAERGAERGAGAGGAGAQTAAAEGMYSLAAAASMPSAAAYGFPGDASHQQGWMNPSFAAAAGMYDPMPPGAAAAYMLDNFYDNPGMHQGFYGGYQSALMQHHGHPLGLRAAAGMSLQQSLYGAQAPFEAAYPGAAAAAAMNPSMSAAPPGTVPPMAPYDQPPSQRQHQSGAEAPPTGGRTKRRSSSISSSSSLSQFEQHRRALGPAAFASMQEGDHPSHGQSHHRKSKGSSNAAEAKRKEKKRRARTFPEKLMQAFVEGSENEDAVAWLPDGKSFVIVSADLFVKDVLGHIFKSCKYASFVRKLHRWGFVRLTSGTGTDCFHHPLFQKGRRDLASKISCTPRDKDNMKVGRYDKPPSLAGVERFIRARAVAAAAGASGSGVTIPGGLAGVAGAAATTPTVRVTDSSTESNDASAAGPPPPPPIAAEAEEAAAAAVNATNDAEVVEEPPEPVAQDDTVPLPAAMAPPVC